MSEYSDNNKNKTSDKYICPALDHIKLIETPDVRKKILQINIFPNFQKLKILQIKILKIKILQMKILFYFLLNFYEKDKNSQK